MKKNILSLILFVSIVFTVCPAPSSEAGIATLEIDKSLQMLLTVLETKANEMMSAITSTLGLSTIDGARDMNKKLEEMLAKIRESQNAVAKLVEDSGKIFEEIEKDMSELEFSQEARDAASRHAFSEMAKLIGEDVLKKLTQQGASVASVGASGPVSGAASSGSASSGGTPGSDAPELSEQAKEHLGKHYPYSLPEVLMKTMQEIFKESANFEDASRGSRAVGEEARTLVQKYGIELFGKYMADKDSGMSHYEKIADEVAKSEQKINEDVKEDLEKTSSEELEALRQIAALNAAMVRRQMNTNVLLIAQMWQANDRAKMLSHNASMLAESYGQSLERWMRVHAREQFREGDKRQ